MSKRLSDITGQNFGRWTVIECAGRGKHGELQYKCRCRCGTERILRRSSLTSGNSKSCGCLARDVSREKETTHGASGTRLYRIWAGIIQRCCNSRERYEWEKYGGRGISICDEWRNSFETFRRWALDNGYSENLSIDRIDVNKGYCPENCRWATVYEQNNNKRTSRKITFCGETGTIREFSDRYGLDYSCLYARLKSGWTIEKALLTPSNNGRSA